MYCKACNNFQDQQFYYNNNNNNNNNNKMILIEYQLHFQSVPRNVAWGSISADRAFNVSTMAEDNISVHI